MKYKYVGAQASDPLSRDFPEPIEKLAELIRGKFTDCTINQCLINRFIDKEAHLPEHSDDEASIVHGSDIFTVSLGASCDVHFVNKSDPNKSKKETIEGNSIYVMSKASQSTWRHRIDKCAEQRDLRYSITFRYISNNSRNSTILIGDSNTRFVKFGNGKGTFGDKLPGKRVLAFTIDQIKPESCAGFSNVFVHCGINDLRQNRDVRECVSKLTRKLDQICELCPSSRINVSPILPTRLEHLNGKARMFNDLLFNYINNVNTRVGSLNFDRFLDQNGLLDRRFCRYRDQSDPIHLGSTGILTLASLISSKVFKSTVDGRLYSNVIGRREPNPRLSGNHAS